MIDNVKPARGPWSVGPHYKSDVESPEGRVCECAPMTSPRAEANARLIAAAPELLDLVRRFASGDMKLPHSEYDMKLRAEARALIAKAEGR